MYNTPTPQKTTLRVNEAYEGETIENKVNRILNNNEPITDGAPQVYTERKDGVLPEYDIRTDRFEIAVDAHDKITRSHIAKREQTMGEKTYDTMTPEQQKEFNTKFPNNKHAQKQQQQASQNKTGG